MTNILDFKEAQLKRWRVQVMQQEPVNMLQNRSVLGLVQDGMRRAGKRKPVMALAA